MRQRAITAAVVAACLVMGATTFPRWWCGRSADDYFDGILDAHVALGDRVAHRLDEGVTPDTFNTGAALFDGEWAFITNALGVVGLGQVVMAHPELRERYLPTMLRAADRLVTPELLAFGAVSWGEDPLVALEGETGHAYLGYLGMALGMLRVVAPDNPHAALHDAMAAAFARRIRAATDGIIETYPGEVFPADISTLFASVGLHVHATGDAAALADVLPMWAARMEPVFAHPTYGVLVQSLAPDGTVRDGARASGTALAAYALTFADRAASERLLVALEKGCLTGFLGFGAVREYPRGLDGSGDIDSGPVLFGTSVSATGFALASLRVHGRRDAYRSIIRTVNLFGVPVDTAAGRHHITGGPIGDAVLLALMTAAP